MPNVYNYQMTSCFLTKGNMMLESKEVYALEVENSVSHIFITFLAENLTTLDTIRFNQDQSSLNIAESLLSFWCGDIENPSDLRRHFKEILPVVYYK